MKKHITYQRASSMNEMAKKRMINLTVIDTDAFMDMPLTTQALYFHLNMRADDDGFVGNPKKTTRLIGASEDDLTLLKVKNFVIQFDDGVIVIKHWRMHNTLSAGRYTETNFIEDKAMLRLKENNAYTLGYEGSPLDDRRLIEMGKRQVDEQKTNNRRTIDEQKTSIDKNRLDKNRLEEDKEESKKSRFTPPTLEEVEAYVMEKYYDVNPEAFFNFYESKGWMVGKNKMKDWKKAIAGWNARNRKGGLAF